MNHSIIDEKKKSKKTFHFFLIALLFTPLKKITIAEKIKFSAIFIISLLFIFVEKFFIRKRE